MDARPPSRFTFLGLELDSSARVIHLPEDQLVHLCRSLEDWSNHKATRKRDLLSLIGHLQHAAKAGRSFFRRLIDLSSVAHHLDSFVQLNVTARIDITWWRTFAQQWNGTVRPCSTTTTSSTHRSMFTLGHRDVRLSKQCVVPIPMALFRD